MKSGLVHACLNDTSSIFGSPAKKQKSPRTAIADLGLSELSV